MRYASSSVIVVAMVLSGCFVNSGGGLEGDVSIDTNVDASVDSSLDLPTDVDDDEDVIEEVTDAWDVVTDTPVDTVIDTLPDTVSDTIADTTTESGECSTTWDPVCDDGFECTTDFCDMVTYLCQHSGATMEGAACSDDGNECTDDYCRGGVCVHDAYREGDFCTDDMNTCTDDYCASGVCVHDGVPRNGFACAADAESCTLDECQGGTCEHIWQSGCCHRDGDCIWADHIWECDSGAEICYHPTEGLFCDDCTTREDCGNGGPSSDDWCIYPGDGSSGCGTDCADDYDCPRGSTCEYFDSPVFSNLCVVKVGNCETWQSFGDSCSGDPDCGGPDNYCIGICSWDCTTDDDCPPQSTGCTGGSCRM